KPAACPGHPRGRLHLPVGHGSDRRETGERNLGAIGDQVRTTLSNMRHMLESAGSSLERVLRVHVVLADISHMAEMDRVYREFFPTDPPARMVWSMQLRFGNGCEIECVALAGCRDDAGA